MHAQVVTPGVIFNSEHLVEYGEAEEGLIKSNPDFHNEYKKFCEKLNIRPVTVTDKNGQEHNLAGHPEIKGVRGIDKRKYLFDLIHLFPRDLNYPGNSNGGCLLRPELVKEYQLKLIYQKIAGEYQEEMKKINSDVEAYLNNAKDPNSYIHFIEEKYKRKEELYDKINNEIKPMVQLNTTLETENKLLKYSSSTNDNDKEFLETLAKYLKDDTLNKFLVDVNKDDDVPPSDSFTLTESVHKYGINVRYYGEIIKLIDNDTHLKKNNKWVKSLIIRDIFRRCAKHIYNSIAIDVPEYLLKDFTAYFLNLLLSPGNTLKSLDNFELVFNNNTLLAQKPVKEDTELNTAKTSTTTSNVTNVKDKKKKTKSKKKKTPGQTETVNIKSFVTDSINSKPLNSMFEFTDISKYFIKPSVFWSKVRDIASARYDYTIPVKENYDYIEPVINKFGLLRDVCLTLGIQVEALDYDLITEVTSSTKGEFKYTSLSFKADNIKAFNPIVKDYQLPSDIHRPIFEQAEALFKAENLAESSEKYRQILYLSNEIFGPINYYSGIANKRLADISCVQGDYMNGIALLQKAIVINEKLYNYDTNFVANCYTELATYYHFLGQDYFSFNYISRALSIIHFTYPKNVSSIFLF